MVRLSQQSHQRRIMIAMAIYVAVFLWVWPLARSTDALWLKAAYALAPVPPLLYVIWLMARRVLAGDELEQRTHLIGLGVAAAAVSIFGIVSGFLAAAHVLSLDWTATALVWIFPLLVVVYSAARAYAARRYGGSACDDVEMSSALRFLYLAVLFAAIAACVYWRKGDADGAGLAAGMAAGMLSCAAFFALRQRLRRRVSGE
jgi:small-conductance mechanosensitive channel